MMILLLKLRCVSLLLEELVSPHISPEITSGFLKGIISVQSRLNTNMFTDTVNPIFQANRVIPTTSLLTGSNIFIGKGHEIERCFR